MNLILNKILIITSFLLLTIHSNLQAEGFNSVFSKDGSDVWAVGISGNLFHSFDGGNTWAGFTLGSVNLNSVFSISSNVWIVGNNGSLQRSSNNGLGWTPYTLSAQNLNSVFFTDANTGWTVGNGGTILKTVNGGINWTPQTSPVATNLNSVKFTSSSNGIICGEGGKVLYTNNGGTTWLQYTTPTAKNLLSVDQKTNTIIASAADGIVIKSTNSGSTWSIIDYKIVTKSDVYSVHMLDANTYYSCGGGGFIRKSTDGGATFTYQINPMMANLVSIYFYDNLKGWAVSSKNNAVIRTIDGGNTWLLPPGTTLSYNWSQKLSAGGNIGNDICLHPTDKKAVFVACGSTIYRSGNIGENWTSIATISFSGSAHSFYVSPRDTNLMLAAVGSSGGRIVRSTNYGQTWTSTWGPGSLTSYGMPIEMDPNHPDTVYLGPNSSVILRSTDFGATWSNHGTTSFTDPCDLVVLYNNSNVMYVGDQSGGGKFWKSTDYGVNWTQTYNAGGAEIPM
ncbi:MAG: WD40/YVTN/BNR-like repeat-containing protein, partial [Ignavibacteria bacterium]